MDQNAPVPGADKHVLQRILTEAREHRLSGRPFLAVFDLDSTLFDLTLRVSKIMDDFAADPAFQNAFPAECELLKKAQVLRTDWGIAEALGRLGLTDSKHANFCRELHRYWAAAFFSNDYLHHDQPLPGAVDYVAKLSRIGADLMYLTGRDTARMYEGTEKSLRETGFPLGPAERAQLVLKPAAGMNDAEFKVSVLKEALARYDKIWLFENEPVNLNLVARNCPAIGLVFIESTHSGREQVAGTLDKIPHFEVDMRDFEDFAPPKR